jgi:hypothetical protein
MNELTKLNASIDAWAVKNGLDELKESDQTLKIIEEIGELSRAMLKKDIAGQKDAIGDIYIALRVYMLQIGGIFEDEEFHYYFTDDLIRPSYQIERLCSEVQNLLDGNDFFKEVQYMSQFLELDFTNCVEHAFNEVKDRDLKIVNGVAVKEDLEKELEAYRDEYDVY